MSHNGPQWPNPARLQDVAKIHEAMETCGGDLTEASKILGMTRLKLQRVILNSPDLKGRWSKRRTPTKPPENVELDAARDLVTQDDAALEQIFKREDDAFRRGLERMGVSGTRLEVAVQFQGFGGRHYTGMLKMIAGGLADQFMALRQEYENITAELDAGGRDMEVIDQQTLARSKRFVPLTVYREKLLRDDRAKINEQMQRMSDRAHKAALTQAVIKHKLEGRMKGQGKPKSFLDLGDAKVVNMPEAS